MTYFSSSKKTLSANTLFRVLLVCFLSCAPVDSWGQEDLELYFLEDVQVVETDQDARLAKKNAYAEAVKKAYDQLMQRLGAEKMTTLPLEGMKALVHSHRVVSEKFSQTTYRATYNVQFDPELVDKMLGEQNIKFLSQRAAPTVIVPVYDDSYPPLSFHEESPWLKAWSAKLPFSISPLIFPEGDGKDLGSGQDIIDPIKRNMGLKTLLERYPGKYVAVVTLRPQAKKLLLEIYDEETRKLNDQTIDVESVEIPHAVNIVVEQLNQWFRGSKATPLSIEGHFQVVVQYTSFGQVLPLFRCLAAEKDAPHLELVRLEPQRAIFALSHHKDVADLKGFFAEMGFDIEKVGPQWVAKARPLIKKPQALLQTPKRDPERAAASADMLDQAAEKNLAEHSVLKETFDSHLGSQGTKSTQEKKTGAADVSLSAEDVLSPPKSSSEKTFSAVEELNMAQSY
ncbi:DUF2066 domain-containing protein [Alphaproteobacteria bacterium]|nr:DUF2066 domain-containing protein [Alphaproteobacteria bacterium]